MKMKREHLVPLSPQALAVLKIAMAVRLDGTDLVFPGTNGPMSDITLLAVLRRMKEPFTAHGFRSSFRTWVAEKTNFPGDVAEAALALLGKPVLTYNPLSADKYHNVLDLMGAIHDVMEREGDWKPRDLWDVQGFIWAVNRADNAQPEIAASTSAHRPL